MKQKTMDVARGRWVEILTAFGVDPKYLTDKHKDCPFCGGSDRFRFDDNNGNGTFFCGQCHSAKGLNYSGLGFVMKLKGLSFADAAKEVDDYLGVNQKAIQVHVPQENKQSKKAYVIQLGNQLQQLQSGDVVHKYLNSRGIVDIPHGFIKCHPGQTIRDNGKFLGIYPAMAVALTHPDNKHETYHFTYLTKDGMKASVPVPKKIVGTTSSRGITGSAIRLSPVTKHIGITEGIETALSVKELYGINCWASATANNLMEFRPPKGVEEVTIFPDIDESFTGQASAYNLAKRLRLEGIKVNMAEHLPMGKDYNDLLVEVKHGRTA